MSEEPSEDTPHAADTGYSHLRAFGNWLYGMTGAFLLIPGVFLTLLAVAFTIDHAVLGVNRGGYPSYAELLVLGIIVTAAGGALNWLSLRRGSYGGANDAE